MANYDNLKKYKNIENYDDHCKYFLLYFGIIKDNYYFEIFRTQFSNTKKFKKDFEEVLLRLPKSIFIKQNNIFKNISYDITHEKYFIDVLHEEINKHNIKITYNHNIIFSAQQFIFSENIIDDNEKQNYYALILTNQYNKHIEILNKITKYSNRHFEYFLNTNIGNVLPDNFIYYEDIRSIGLIQDVNNLINIYNILLNKLNNVKLDNAFILSIQKYDKILTENFLVNKKIYNSKKKELIEIISKYMNIQELEDNIDISNDAIVLYLDIIRKNLIHEKLYKKLIYLEYLSHTQEEFIWSLKSLILIKLILGTFHLKITLEVIDLNIVFGLLKCLFYKFTKLVRLL